MVVRSSVRYVCLGWPCQDALLNRQRQLSTCIYGYHDKTLKFKRNLNIPTYHAAKSKFLFEYYLPNYAID